MGIWEIVIGFVVLLLSVIMIIVIILQEGHDAGLGTITGGADSFMKRGKAKTADAMFAKITKVCAITFFVFIVLLNALSYFGWTGKPKDETPVETSTVSEASATEESKEEASKDESKDESKTEASADASKTESSAEASKTESKTEASGSSEAASSTESSAAEQSSAAESTAESAA